MTRAVARPSIGHVLKLILARVHRLLGPPRSICAKDFRQDVSDVVGQIPAGVMILKFTDVADPPNVIANSVGFLVGPIEFLTGNVLTELNRFEH